MEFFTLIVIGVVALLLWQRVQERVRAAEDKLTRQQSDYQRLLQLVETLQHDVRRLQQAPPAAPTPPVQAPVTAPAPLTAPTPAAAPAAVPPRPAPVSVPSPAPVASTPPPVVPTPPTPVPAPPVPAPPAPAPAPSPEPPIARPMPPVAEPVPAATPPVPPRPAVPRPAPRPQPVPAEPAGPSWWDRVSAVVLENWTGILGAVILVTGVGFLGVYTALRLAPIYRFFLINGFALSLLGVQYYLRTKPFAAQLRVWLQSSAAAIFLFTCVGAVSIPGLRWVSTPFDYALLFAGAAVNLWLAWNSSREAVATLHGTLSLVALAVLPPTLVTLAAAAAVTAFAILITYRQRWRYQLLLSILSFFAFHVFWHSQLPQPVSSGVRFGAIGLVLLVGVAAAVVQYRKAYATGRFEALLFAAHVLNWTCLGISLYLHSTGSVWKTVPLGLGAVATFFVARHARRLGIQWLFQTDTVISLLLALATAFSLQGWHATTSVILVFMLLESLLVAFIMARERENLVFQIAAVGALLAGVGLLLANLLQLPTYSPTELHRNALLLGLAAAAGAAYFHLVRTAALLSDTEESAFRRELYRGFGGVVGALYAGGAALMLQALFGAPQPPVYALLAGLLVATAGVLALAHWLRTGPAWFRQLHLLVAQLLLTVAVLGLHKTGLSWPTTLLVLYAETLLAAWLLARRAEPRVQYIITAFGQLMGVVLLISSLHLLPTLPARLLAQRAAGLLLAAVLGAAFYRHTDAQRTSTPDLLSLVRLLWTLGGVVLVMQYLGLLGLLLQAFFGRTPVPAWGVLGGTAAAAGVAFGLSQWLRGGTPWLRYLHLLAGQALLMVAALGLHEVGLSWPAATLAVYLETLLMTLLLAGRQEWPVYRVLLLTTLLLAVLLPFAAYRLDSHTLIGATTRSGLLLLAALATAAAQVWLARRNAPAFDALPVAYDPAYRLRILGIVPGLLLLAASGLVYHLTWYPWVVAAAGAALLGLRRAVHTPGLWLGLLLLTAGTYLLQWVHIGPDTTLAVGRSLLYLLPTLALPLAGLATSWWAARERHVRWPWLYLLGLHVLVSVGLAFSPTSDAEPVLGWALLAGLAFAVAQVVAGRWATDEARQRAGQPDRFLLHLSYLFLGVALCAHLANVVGSAEQWLGWPAQRFTAAALLLVLSYLVLTPAPPATPYRSWRALHPWLPELTLLLAVFTLHWETRPAWHPLLWIGLALLLTTGGTRLPLRLRRLGLYGLPLYGLAALSACYNALRYLSPGHWLETPWLATTGAVMLLFAYAALVLRRIPTANGLVWPPGLEGLSRLGRLRFRVLVPALLYPAFVALALVLIQSFDRSVLTVLLMLEVMGVFVSSLLLRRRDLRYVSLTGIGVCMVRLVFFDLGQRGTITQAVVFIFMGLLLLGMNALYARFKNRFSAPAEPAPDDAPNELLPDEPDPALTP
ncbi:hypothetical protein [Hymenobacter sp. CRA2]|uniref:hypothetical protein n=1 Tax=Hymenobacter sp. CRA2 TaxID=1955620 RepID=UPI00098FF163|nr:hypothetical protein [Hymenobacter sp. CRA2]OON67412.1 hypothetical protein B0919_18280 [Hymenobacter sp. CRA2]